MADRPAENLPTIRDILSRGHLRLVMFAVMLLAGILLLSSLLLMRGYVASNLELSARSIAYSVEPAVYFGDVEAVRETIGSVGASGSVRLIEVSGADGGLLATGAPAGAPADGSFQATVDRLVWPQAVVEPIRSSGEIVGHVRVYGSAAQFARFLISSLVIVLCCLGITIIATRALARRLEEEVLGPLDRVAEIAEAVGQDRDFDRRVAPSGLAEVDRFSREFNSLLGELQGWHHSVSSENAALMHLAEHDPLTGLGNRTRFQRLLDAEIERADRTGSSFAVLFIDVDRFKQINDLHGHLAGDIVLRGIATRLRDMLRHEDEAFRLGGDEFAILAPPSRNQAVTANLVARIQEAAEMPQDLPGGGSIAVSVSIGQALYPDHESSAGALLSRADHAMYQRKRERKGNG